ncbi:MAG: SH3 domain-containing protein [bacterium]|nr:SH3 domain-containing protein [bacterium]
MKKIIFFTFLFFALATVVRAQYTPSVPGSLGIGKVTPSSVEWTFNLNGAMVTEIQLFVGDETSPRVKQAVANYATSIVETGLTANTRYENRKIRAMYYGTPGPFSNTFPAALTLQKIPTLVFEPLPPNNILIRTEGDAGTGEGLTAWQVYNVTQGELRGLVSTQNLQLGPFESGKTYVFKVRAQNVDGMLTDWSSGISYTMPGPLSSSPSPSSSANPQAGQRIVLKLGVSALNVRTLPAISGRRIGYMRPSQEFEALETQNGWYRIQFTSTVQGWVSGKYVRAK